MKKVVVLLATLLVLFTCVVSIHAEETESAVTEETTAAETEAETEAPAEPLAETEASVEPETEEDEVANIIAVINSLTPEEFQSLQDQILALSKATGWEAVDEWVNDNIFGITLVVFVVGVVVYFAFFKNSNRKIANGLGNLSLRSESMIEEATKISEESKKQAEEATAAITGYLQQANTVLEKLTQKDQELAEKDAEIADLETQFKTELSNNKGAVLAMASCINSLLQMSGIPDEEKALIRVRYENEVAKMEGGEQK